MNWNDYLFDIVDVVSTKSKDRDTKHGCIITDSEHRILATGYNSFPTGMNDSFEERYQRPLKYKYMVHAERNAVFSAAKNGVSLKDSILYVSGIPCMDCAHAIIQSGVKKVIFDGDKQKNLNSPMYQDHKLVFELFNECNVRVIEYVRNS